MYDDGVAKYKVRVQAMSDQNYMQPHEGERTSQEKIVGAGEN